MDLKKWTGSWLKEFFTAAKKLFFKDYISFDIETTGLSMCRDEIHFFTYDLNGKTGLVMMRPDLVDWRKEIPKPVLKALQDDSIKKIIHSSQFDIPFFRMKTGIHLRNIWDTAVIEQVILGGRGNPWTDAGLDATLRRRKIAKLNKDVRESFIDYWGPITDKQKKYGVDDIKWLRKLALQQIKDIEKAELQNVAELENRTCEVTAELRFNGIAFDEQFWIDLAEENQKKYDDLIKKLPKKVSNWNSPQQIKKFFEDEHGITIESLSELPEVRNKDLDAFKKAREMFSSTSTYGLGFLFRDGKKRSVSVVDPDGRIRPSYNQLVDTGRYSCSKPNLQNQPAFGKHRYAYIAPLGSKLVGKDFGGQELGIIAYGSQEPSWLNAMRKNHDLHSVKAADIVPGWEKKKEKGCTYPFKCKCKWHNEQRRPVKDLNFGISYGKGVESFAEAMKMGLAEAGKWFRAWKKSNPKVMKWLDSNGNFAVKFGWIRTLPPFNRIRYLFEEPWRKRNQGKNTPIQGSGADMMKLAMCLMYYYMYEKKLTKQVKLVLTVHDELLSEVKNAFVKQWCSIAKYLMEEAAKVITKEVLIKVEPEVFDNKMLDGKVIKSKLSDSRWKPKS